jgi:hypothetical protein
MNKYFIKKFLPNDYWTVASSFFYSRGMEESV